MKKLLFLLLITGALKSTAQSTDGKTQSTATPSATVETDTDSIPVEYVKNQAKQNEDHSPAFFANGHFLKAGMSHALSPDKIKSVNVVRRDTIIGGKKYYGMIFVELKKHLPTNTLESPKEISLNALKDNYTTLKGKPALFTIDGKFINADYNTYQINKNMILKIIVEPFTNNNPDNPSWLVKILTKTKENTEKANTIKIRGSSGSLTAN